MPLAVVMVLTGALRGSVGSKDGRGPRLPVLLLTAMAEPEDRINGLEQGADDFLAKPFRDQDMLDAVAAALGRARAARDSERVAADLRASYEQLTTREREVMALVTAGLMNKQAAAELGLSEITVKIHRGQAMRKMKAKSLADLVRMAESLGLHQKAHPP